MSTEENGSETPASSSNGQAEPTLSPDRADPADADSGAPSGASPSGEAEGPSDDASSPADHGDEELAGSGAATSREEEPSEQPAEAEEADPSEGADTRYHYLPDGEEVGEEYADYKFVTEHSRYEDDAAAAEGIQRKDEYISELQQDLQAERDQRSEKQAQLEERLSFYESRMPEEALREALVEQYMPDEYEGKSEDDFLDEDDLVDYRVAKREAEQKADDELASIGDGADREAEREEYRDQLKDAADHVEELFTGDDALFRMEAPEDEQIFRETVEAQTDEDGRTPIQIAQLASALIGPQAGQLVAAGLARHMDQARLESADAFQEQQSPPSSSRVPDEDPSGADEAPPASSEPDYRDTDARDLTGGAMREMHRG